MDPHRIELPRIIISGKGVIGKTLEVCRDLGIDRPLVLMDVNTKGIAGDPVMGNVSPLSPASEIVKASTQEEVDRILSVQKGFGSVIGVGGGVVIDVGKMVAFKSRKPFISVPTAPSHDGIASERASLTDGGMKVSLRAEPPAAIIADTSILMNAPYRLIASGCADLISNITSVEDWKLGRKRGEYYSEYAANLAMMSAEIVMKSARMIRNREERGIRNLVEAIITSSISMSMAKSSRPASGSEHAFSHAMEMILSERNLPHPLHGEQVGVGSILMSYHQGGDWKGIRDALRSVGAPTTAGELGVEPSVMIESLLKARDIRERHTILHEKPLTEKSARMLAIKTGVAEDI